MQPHNHATHTINPAIFREYDIRGVVGKTLFAEDAFYIGKKYATMLGSGKKIAIGRDGRLTSPELTSRLIAGLLESGVNVVDVGICPSPMLYFSVFHLNLDGGIMVTGSHNPPEHNGFKMLLGTQSLYGEKIKELEKIEGLRSEVKGLSESVDVQNDYMKRITLALSPKTLDLKVGWDSGNGAAGEVVEKLAAHLPGIHIAINSKIDGNFPAHHPDPSVAENLQELINLVLEKKLDVGFAFDGDGDRIGVVDDKGRIMWGDQILAILARQVLAEKPGATIIADIKSSSVFESEVTRLGGNPVLWKTGHSLIKAKMKELGAPLAGEMSAHIFFADHYYGYDDGIYAALRFLNIMATSGMKASELYDSLPQTFSSPELRIECPDDKKFEIIEKIKLSINNQQSTINNIDGIRVTTDCGWWLIRASNTGGYIIARWEADSKEGYERIKSALGGLLEKHGLSF